jgi:hypothetical protein
VLAALRRHRREEREAAADAVERARQWLLQYEDAVLDDLLASGDPRILLEVWRTLKRYGDGEPVSRVSVEVSAADPGKLLAEIARERALRDRERDAVTVEALSPVPPDA